LTDDLGGVMVSVLASSVVYRGFQPLLDQTKDYKIGIRCFSSKHSALRRKSKDWLTWIQGNVKQTKQNLFPVNIFVQLIFDITSTKHSAFVKQNFS
jgi:hypothetical protein